MAIREPATERVFPADPITVCMVATWDGLCTDCMEPIALDEPYWDWHFGPASSLFMHLDCFAAWAARIAKAALEVNDA